MQAVAMSKQENSYLCRYAEQQVYYKMRWLELEAMGQGQILMMLCFRAENKKLVICDSA